MVKLADAPPCLGGGEYGKPVRANYSLKVRLLPLQQLSSKIRNQPKPKSYYLINFCTFKLCWVVKLADTPSCLGGGDKWINAVYGLTTN